MPPLCVATNFVLTPSNATLNVCATPVPRPVILILFPALASDAFAAN